MTAQATKEMLACLGGEPVRRSPWPPWPPRHSSLPRSLEATADSGRWAISGFWTGEKPLDQRFGEAFADYLGVAHALPCDHGSSALVMALEALGIGRGDEVLVPALTWVACASAVLRVNAEPVLIDVDPRTLCLDPVYAEAAVTKRTAAILVVHLYSSMADLDGLRAIADRHGLFLIEDSAQAHGATWRGQRAGGLGDIGTFSFQQGKTMTCGEGGAAVTDDRRLAAALELLRGDGRRYRRDTPAPGEMQLAEIGTVQGRNYGLSEFQLATLLTALGELDGENRRRAENAERLAAGLDRLPGWQAVEALEGNDFRSYYHFALRFDPAAFAGRSADTLGWALGRELGTWVHPPYAPLSRHPLLQPGTGRRFAGAPRRVRSQPAGLPEAERQVARTLLLHHSCLLAEAAAMDDVLAACDKVRRHAAELPQSPPQSSPPPPSPPSHPDGEPR